MSKKKIAIAVLVLLLLAVEGDSVGSGCTESRSLQSE